MSAYEEGRKNMAVLLIRGWSCPGRGKDAVLGTIPAEGWRSPDGREGINMFDALVEEKLVIIEENPMGMIRIEMSGSFDRAESSFSAMDGGHADAISQAIEWLAATAMPRAIEKDHALSANGQTPKKPFGRGRHEH